MNQDEVMSLVRKVLIMVFTALATKYHLDGSQIPALAGDLASVGVIIWGVYAHWNMVKVPESQQVPAIPPVPATPGGTK